MKPANQVIQVLAWRTEDGELFAAVQEANAHAAKLNFIHWYRYNALRSGASGDLVDGRDLAAWLIDNRAAVLDLLAATKGE